MKYIHEGQLKSLPATWKAKDGGTISDFRNWAETNPEGLIKEGWLPVTKRQDYNGRVHGKPIIAIFPDHAEVTYKERDLPAMKEQKKRDCKREGREMYKAKWDLEYMVVGMYSDEEKIEADANRDTLFGYYKQDVEPLIDSAETLKELDEVICFYPWIQDTPDPRLEERI